MTVPSAESPPANPAPDPMDACAPATMAGTWLLESGTTTLTCSDGRRSVMVAGGTVEITNQGGVLMMADGPCQHRFSGTGCSFAAPAGKTCTFDGVPYTVEALELARDDNGAVSLLYRMRRPDRDHPGGSCVDVTEARLVHGADERERCVFSGTFTSAVTALGTPGPITLSIADGVCRVSAPDYQGFGRCERGGGLLRFAAAASWSQGEGCASEKEARYRISFAHGCKALVLESEDDACEVRQAAVDYLYLSR